MKTVKCCCSYWKCITYNKLFALVRGLKAVLEASISPVFNLCKSLYTEVRFFWGFFGGVVSSVSSAVKSDLQAPDWEGSSCLIQVSLQSHFLKSVFKLLHSPTPANVFGIPNVKSQHNKNKLQLNLVHI